MRIGVYPGSFDPFTIGHHDVLKGALRMFDLVYVSVLRNSSKTPVFSTQERVDMIRRMVEDEGWENVRVAAFDGLLVEHAREIGAGHIIRGLRAITDFEYEFQIASMNKLLEPEVQTVYFMASPEHSFLSSSIIREVGSMGGNIRGLVPDSIYNFIAERLKRS